MVARGRCAISGEIPPSSTLWIRYRLAPERWLREQLILNLVESFTANSRTLEAKTRYVRASMVLLAVEVVYLAMALVIAPFLS